MARILIIDDEPILCEYLSDLFRDAKHEVLFVHTLQDGINLLTQDTFDAVFLDVMLPDGNGLTGLSQMRDVPSTPEIIIITGLANRAEAEIAIKNGAWDYIQKPFSASQIKDCLSSVLQYQQEKASRPSSGKVDVPILMVIFTEVS